MTSPERMLELGAHETISISGVREDEEVNPEHEHVEEDGDQDETDGARDEVSNPKSSGDASVAK